MGGDVDHPPASDPVVAIYRVALPQVYGYLLPRCGSASLAEDLVSETFLAAVTASRQGRPTEVNVAWLVGWEHLRRHDTLGIHATETLLTRSRAALRRQYREEHPDAS